MAITQRSVESEIKLLNQGAYVGEHLSFGFNGKGHRGNAIAANRTREIRLSGMRGGLAETWIKERADLKVEKRKRRKAMLLPKVARAVFLPD